MKKISLSEYKKYYFDTEKCIPGEHHFVAVYLLNKFNKIPDYLNPDGMKGSLSGDIGFKKENKSFSIEVKLGKKNSMSSISFTASQYEKWFVKSEDIPNYLIVLIKDSFFIIEFATFVIKYQKEYQSEIIKFKNITGKKKNGPTINEDYILTCCNKPTERFDLDDEKGILKRFKELNMEIEKNE